MKKLLLIGALAAASWATYHWLSATGIEKTAVNPAVQLQQGQIAKDAAQRAADAAKDAATKTGAAAEDAGK